MARQVRAQLSTRRGVQRDHEESRQRGRRWNASERIHQPCQARLGARPRHHPFSWTPGVCEDVFACGTMTWDLDIDEEHLDNASLTVYAYIVETAADYEEGTNGLGTYPHIVRDMIDVGDTSQGSMMVSLPTPHDGDDLEVHLLYEIMPNPPEVMEEEPEPAEPSEDTPALSAVSTMMVVGLALAFTQRIRRDR